MYFDDRIDAARQLADALRGYRNRHPLVLAVPRGAVPMAGVIASCLGGDLDVVLVRKLRAPGSGELAMGAVDEGGWTFIPEYVNGMGLDPAYLRRERHAQLEVLRERRALYTPGRQGFDPKGRVAIVVDDGLATGSTMAAALHAVRARDPARLVCAVPVAARDGLARIRGMADEIVCLATPVEFGAVGRFYRAFPPVSDAEVGAILRASARAPATVAS